MGVHSLNDLVEMFGSWDKGSLRVLPLNQLVKEDYVMRVKEFAVMEFNEIGANFS